MKPVGGWRWRRDGCSGRDNCSTCSGPPKGAFGVDDPVFAEERIRSQAAKSFGVGERCEFSGQLQLATLESRSKSRDELATKDAPEYLDGKKEAWVRANPAGVIAGESAGGNDTVDVGMKLEFLVPGMEHTEEADLRAEMRGSRAISEQSCSAGVNSRS